MVGHGARRTIEKGLSLTGGGNKDMVEEGVPVFLDYYADNIAVGSKPWDGVEAALDALAASDYILAICTNKSFALAEKLVAELGWAERFAAVVGSDSVTRHKPDPEHVLEAVHRAGGIPERSLFVGDSHVDVSAARAAGLPVIVTSFGYSDVPASDLGADAVIDHFDALIPALSVVASGIFGQGALPA